MAEKWVSGAEVVKLHRLMGNRIFPGDDYPENLSVEMNVAVMAEEGVE